MDAILVDAVMASIDFTIEALRAVDNDVVVAFHRLLAELGATTFPSLDTLRAIVESNSVVVLVARNSGNRMLIGTLTLVMIHTPTGIRARIEDVVVDPVARGRGIGEALSRHAIRIATARQALTVDLTSKPSREAANRLYLRLGFRRVETNVYRFTPASGASGEAG